MSNDTSAFPSPPPPPLAPPHLNYTLGCRPFASASLRAACAHVRENPLCAGGDLDYLSFYYCDGTRDASAAGSFAAAPHWLKFPMLALWTTALFAAIAAVANRFFAPAVERIARRARLSEDVAGATLLALGGAAPDIFTQAAAIAESAAPDVRLAISESVGAGLFVATVGKALAIFVGLSTARGSSRARGSFASTAAEPAVEVDAFPYARDALAYGGLILVTAVVVADGEITTPEAFAFVAWYAAYVWAVLRGEDAWRRAFVAPKARGSDVGGGVFGVVGTGRDVEMIATNATSIATSATNPRSNPSSARSAAPDAGTRVFDSAADLRGLAERRVLAETDGEERERLVAKTTRTSADAPDTVLSGERILAASFRRGGGGGGGGGGSSGSSTSGRDGALASLRRWAVIHGGLARDDDASCSDDDEMGDVSDDGDFGPGRRRSKPKPRRDRRGASPDWPAYASAPILLLMSLTMVSTNVPGRAARAHLAVVFTLGPFFAATVTGARASLESAAGPFASVAVGVVWTAAAFSFAYARVPPAGVNVRASPALLACTFAVGILWMHACARELVGVFQAAGRIAGVRESLLGATVMAWGASAGDLGGMLATARAGYVKMAVTAALAGPLCQLAMGSGLSMVIVRLRGVPIISELAPNTTFLLRFGAAFVLGYYAFVVPRVHACAFGRAGAWTVAGAYAAACAVFVVWGIASGGED